MAHSIEDNLSNLFSLVSSFLSRYISVYTFLSSVVAIFVVIGFVSRRMMEEVQIDAHDLTWEVCPTMAHSIDDDLSNLFSLVSSFLSRYPSVYTLLSSVVAVLVVVGFVSRRMVKVVQIDAQDLT